MKTLNQYIAESKGSKFDGEIKISMDAWNKFEKEHKNEFPTMFFKDEELYMIFLKEGYPIQSEHIGTYVPKTGKLFFNSEYLKKEDFYI